jgi:hypothetical protein
MKAVEMMMPVPKCLAAKKMLENTTFDMRVEDTRGRKTPMADEMRTMLRRRRRKVSSALKRKSGRKGFRRRNPQDGENVKTEIIVSEVYPITLATAVSMRVASVDDTGRAGGAPLAAAASALANPYIVGQLAE